MDWEFGVSRCKLLCIKKMDNKVLLYSKGNYIHCPRINEKGTGYKKECVCIYIYIYIYTHSYTYLPSRHVLIWELDHKEGRTLKNWLFWTGVLDKTLKSPLDSKEIKPVNLKGNQPWILIGRTDSEVEAPILWPPDANIWPWCWGKLKAEREEGYRGWDGWITSQMQWTWT